MKDLKEWSEALNEGELKEALIRVFNDPTTEGDTSVIRFDKYAVHGNLSDAIDSFCWETTEEGYNFWNGYYLRASKLEKRLFNQFINEIS